MLSLFVLVSSFLSIASSIQIQRSLHTNKLIRNGVSTFLPLLIIFHQSDAAHSLSNSLLLSTDIITASPKVISSIENIERVYKSIRYIEEDIANKGEPKEIISQIKFLLKNYNLKESILSSLDVINKSSFDQAKTHGLAAVEDLSQIFEYFSDEVDNMSGNKFPPKEVLIFAQDALKASKQELKLLIESYPSTLLQDIEAKISAEFGDDKKN